VENKTENVGNQQPRDAMPPDKETIPPNEARDTKEPNPYNDLDTPKKPRIVYILSKIKVPKETPCIIIAEGIYIFARNP
jgi:hypothetical protein